MKTMTLLLLVMGITASYAGDESTDLAGAYFAVIVSDIEVSREWYRNNLQLEQLTRFSEEGRYDVVNLARPGLFVELLQLDAATDRPEGRIQGPFKVGLLVADVEAFAASLPETGTAPRILHDERNRLLMLQLRDPDGYIVQVMQVLED
ncbi:MAG: VOC family protein [Gammaproteobacteria bacterium]|nr:VOC family protein [Gammaproteobacteria bacterium]